MKPPDQPFSLVVATEDADEDVIADTEITAETRIATTIKNIPALTAN